MKKILSAPLLALVLTGCQTLDNLSTINYPTGEYYCIAVDSGNDKTKTNLKISNTHLTMLSSNKDKILWDEKYKKVSHASFPVRIFASKNYLYLPDMRELKNAPADMKADKGFGKLLMLVELLEVKIPSISDEPLVMVGSDKMSNATNYICSSSKYIINEMENIR